MAAISAVLAFAGTGSSGNAAGRQATPAVAAKATAAIPVRRHRVRAVAAQCGQQHPGERGAGKRDHEGEHRRAADRRPALSGQPGLAHREPAPGEAAPGPAVPERLGGHPPAGHRDRPPAQVEQQPLGDGEHREDERRGDGERDPGEPGQVDDPGESGKKNARPKTRPTAKAPRSERPYRVTTSSAGPTTASGQAPTGGERGGEQQAGGERGEQRPAQPQQRRHGHRPRLGGRASRRGAGVRCARLGVRRSSDHLRRVDRDRGWARSGQLCYLP